MRRILQKFIKTTAAGLAAMALAACAGGGGGTVSNVPAGITTAQISGAFTGGTFVAADAGSNTALNRVTVPASAGGEQTFSLPLPAGRTYKFYIVENGGSPDARVYPLYQGSVNRFTVSGLVTIDLGFIDTTTGIAVPSNDITKVAGVQGSGADTAIPASLGVTTYAGADLQGSWTVLQLVSGATPRWVRSSVTIDGSGNAPAAVFASSAGSGTLPAAAYAVTPSGTVTSAPGGFRGLMTRDKGMIVGTSTPNAGDYALVVMVRPGTNDILADLQGSWKYNQLLVGAARAWSRGDAAIDGSGGVSITGVVNNSGPGSNVSTTLAIDATGTVTSPSDPNLSGVLSPDKNLVAIVTTDASGTPSLMLLARTGATFVGADILGTTWRANWLAAGSSSYWGRALLINDPVGNSTIESIVLSFGTSADRPRIVSLFADGTVTMDKTATSKTDFGGIMAIGKNMIIGTTTEDDGSLSLYAFVK
jgi:hypothetical protein